MILGLILDVIQEESYIKLLESKYKALLKRSFKTMLEMYLFDRSLNPQSALISTDHFLSFLITDELVDVYESSWQMKEGEIKGVDVDTIDKEILEWHADNKALIEELKKAYKEHFFELLPCKTFAGIYPELESMRKCKYCGVVETEIADLRDKGMIKTKNARGRHHEIDRINSNKEYTEDNIVLACYWCNNAKTDEFAYDEFKDHVGPAIGKVWQNRLLQ